MLLSFPQFRENRCREAITFLRGNEFIVMHVQSVLLQGDYYVRVRPRVIENRVGVTEEIGLKCDIFTLSAEIAL
jgi:hypothetical protein